ncbi:phospholipase D superfamily protein [Skeletonema marinoi]|uniref:Mitochondrial cardiolipin hydrolase n=1 Tax=Skeletonema marinoi TaxID=267567 RepID=A0AAD9DIE5_9STRA|nr:phospholipase D superfamily protein [Skeletonema marinoi]
MRSRSENNDISVHAIAGTRVVILGLNLKQKDDESGDSSPSATLSAMLSGLTVAEDANGAGRAATESSLPEKNGKSPSHDLCVGFVIDRRDISSGKSTSLNFDGRPIQKFHYGDYTVVPGHQYEYSVRRMIKAPSRSSYSFFSRPKYVAVGSPLVVTVTTEDPSTSKHGIYFNRGAAGSQAYAEKFGEFRKWHRVNKYGTPHWTSTINPLTIPDPAKKKEACAWLSRGLEEALLEFISQAKDSSWQLRVTAYEFTHKEVIHAFAAAVERGVDVKIIHHFKGSHRPKTRYNDVVKDKDGKVMKEWVPDKTTSDTQRAIDAVGFQSLDHARIWHHDTFIERHTSSIMHNKFIILLRDGKPVELWTGSTNFTESAFYGQSNVGHIVRDEGVAQQYLAYWNKLALDPPGRSKRHSASSHDEEDAVPMDEINEQLQPDPAGAQPHDSTTVFFSPRKTSDLLDWYADRMGDAADSVHFTAAFGVSQPLAHVLNQDGKPSPTNEVGVRRSPRIARRIKTDDKLLRYILLDSHPSEHSSKKSRASAEKKGKENDYCDYFDFKKLNSNRIAYGAVLSGRKEGVEDVAPSSEHSEALTGLSTFVDFVHTKFMVIDALTDNPTIITGSANFSIASTEQNDENMLVIQGDTAVADVYFTEFMRLFDHFFSRDKRNESLGKGSKSPRAWIDVVEDDSWMKPFFDPSHQLFRERVLLS